MISQIRPYIFECIATYDTNGYHVIMYTEAIAIQ